jgi:hypothetical protein
MDAVGAEE